MLYWRFVLSVLRNAELSWYTKFVSDPYENKFRGVMSSDWGSSNPSIRSQGSGNVGKFQLFKTLIHGVWCPHMQLRMEKKNRRNLGQIKIYVNSDITISVINSLLPTNSPLRGVFFCLA
jgi:hypothetical protein